MVMMTRIMILLFCLISVGAAAQIPDHVYHKNIRTIKLHKAGDIYSYPAMQLNSADVMELHFDDLFTFTFAGIASTAVDIKGKVLGQDSPHLA